jgi:predicted  nucleic acid-binding Zn-ribbon protein
MKEIVTIESIENHIKDLKDNIFIYQEEIRNWKKSIAGAEQYIEECFNKIDAERIAIQDIKEKLLMDELRQEEKR